MGITNSNASFLARSRRQGVRFDRTLTIGRQQRYVDDATIVRLAHYLDRSVDARSVCSDPYIDSLLHEVLGVHTLDSLDYSDYEGCRLVHDLNTPVAEDLWGQFDVVIDGGCLEHIFNVPAAIENYMRMTRPGGHLFVFTMANNHSGHGLYQLGPDFFHAALQPQYGFHIHDIVLEEHPYPACELGDSHRFYSVAPRETVKGRIQFVSHKPVTIMVHAEKTGETAGFSPWPVQHSYLEAYRDGGTPPKPTPAPGRRRTGLMVLARSIRSRMLRLLPIAIQTQLDSQRELKKRLLRDSRLFRRIELP